MPLRCSPSSLFSSILTLSGLCYIVLSLIAIGVISFSSLATLWTGKLYFKTPLLYVLGFIFTFVR